MSNTKTWLGFAFYTSGKLETQNVLNNIGLSWKSAEKKTLDPIFDWSSLSFDLSKKAETVFLILQ